MGVFQCLGGFLFPGQALHIGEKERLASGCGQILRSEYVAAAKFGIMGRHWTGHLGRGSVHLRCQGSACRKLLGGNPESKVA